MGSKKKVRNQNKSRANKVVETPTKKVEEETETQIMPSAIKLRKAEEQTPKQSKDQNSIPTVPLIEPSCIPTPTKLTEVEVLEDIKQLDPEVTRHPIPEVIKKTIAEVTKNPIPEVTKRAIPEVTKQPIPEITKHPIPEIIKHPIPEVIKHPIPEVIKHSIPEEIKHSVPEVIKHPLENTWGFWLYTNENRKNWTENQKKLTVFDTVEDYWCLYHHIKLPSELKAGQDYAVFKSGISPMWEDRANERGGRWFINLDRCGSEMDRIWLDVVLLMIGENFQSSDIICGAVVNVRQKKRVSVWTRNKDEAANMEIGRKLKSMLQINFKLQFLDHVKGDVLFHI